jgi:DUF971 family protein
MKKEFIQILKEETEKYEVKYFTSDISNTGIIIVHIFQISKKNNFGIGFQFNSMHDSKLFREAVLKAIDYYYDM